MTDSDKPASPQMLAQMHRMEADAMKAKAWRAKRIARKNAAAQSEEVKDLADIEAEINRL